MSKHDHPAPKPPCSHDGKLKFCAPCNAVECTTCGFEWKAPSTNAFSQLWSSPCTRPHRDEPYRWPYIAPQLTPRWPGQTFTNDPVTLPGETYCSTISGRSAIAVDGGAGNTVYISGHKDHS